MLIVTEGFLEMEVFDEFCPVSGWLLRCSTAAILCNKFSVLSSGPAAEKGDKKIRFGKPQNDNLHKAGISGQEKWAKCLTSCPVLVCSRPFSMQRNIYSTGFV